MIVMENNTAPVVPVTHAKQYVFVDEYNRHKRLKVMRACDGCRKRKIRCDGALQNGPWPCGACIRLKLKCVPPSLDQDNDSGPETPDSATSTNQFYFPPVTAFTSHPQQQQQVTGSPSPASYSWASSVSATTPLTANTTPTSVPSQRPRDAALYPNPRQQFPASTVEQRLDRRSTYAEDAYSTSATSEPSQFANMQNSLPNLTRAHTTLSDSSAGDPEEVESAVKELSSHMGDLNVGITAAAPYLTDHLKHAPSAPTVDDNVLPPEYLNDTSIRIPTEMMPHDDRAMDYFAYFFDYIHPYTPVLNKTHFYEQWAMDRSSISPLLLEAIFACSSRYLDGPAETRKWLALAARHEDHFKDVPRLSTIQALIILMKAREFAQKPGYYYRSWMALKYITTMAIDLGLNEHRDKHRGNAISCKLDPSDCLIRTRIWQTLLVLEMFIGGVQNRTDMNVDEETVDMAIPFPAADLNAFEYQTSRRSTVIAQCAKNIKQTFKIMQKKSRANPKEWPLDPEYAARDSDFLTYIKDVPSDMQLHYPEDGSAPWLGGDHFVAGLHAYYHLTVIQHHRPQLQAKLERRDPTFKEHLDICANSAAMMCRDHEALYRDFGLHGLLFMLRGANFTVYCVLTCTMLHLVAITSPDPVLNSQARDYFTRHMRILEYCIPIASPEMQTQINALREAFSLDATQPFELKPTLNGMRSPSTEKQLTPPAMQVPTPSEAWPRIPTQPLQSASPISEYGNNNFAPTSVPSITSHPNISFSTPSEAYNLPASTSYPSASARRLLTPSSVTLSGDSSYQIDPVPSNEIQTPVWDPSGIFNQWHNAFGNPVAPPNSSPTLGEPRMLQHGPTSAPVMGHSVRSTQRTPPGQAALYIPPSMSPTAQSAMPNDVSMSHVPAVTSVMWQDAFTNAYISGHKRSRDDDTQDGAMYAQYQTKRRA